LLVIFTLTLNHLTDETITKRPNPFIYYQATL